MLPPDEQALASEGLQLGIARDEYVEEHVQGDFLIRGVAGADETREGLVVGDLVPVGRTVRFQVRDAAAADADLRESARRAFGRAGRGQVEGALLFSCNGRGAHLFGTADHDPAVVRSELVAHGVAGCFAAGEIGPVAGQQLRARLHRVDPGVRGPSADRDDPSFLAIDVGGTKLAAARVDDDRRRQRRREVPTQPDGGRTSGEALWRRCSRWSTRCAAGEQPAGVGVGCGGPMRLAGRSRVADQPAGLAWVPAAATGCNERFPAARCGWHNDADRDGARRALAGRRARRRAASLGIVVSTGVGGGLVLDGRVVDGADGNAGHVGHVVVEPDGPVCGCGGARLPGGGGTRACGRRVGASARLGSRRQARSRTAEPSLAVARAGDQVAAAAFGRAGNAGVASPRPAAALLELRGRGHRRRAVRRPVTCCSVRRGQRSRRHVQDGVRRPAAGSFRPALGADAGLVGAAALVLCGDRYWTAVQTERCD